MGQRSPDTIRLLIALGLSWAIVVTTTANAEIKQYAIQGDLALHRPFGDLTGIRVVRGITGVRDTHDGTPTLEQLKLSIDWSFVDDNNSEACCLGTTLSIVISHELEPAALPIVGSGDTSSSIDWGVVSPWTNSGQVFCETTPGPSCPGCQACLDNGFTEGIGPPIPVSPSIDLETWTFANGAASFESTPFQIVNLECFELRLPDRPGNQPD